MCQGELSPWRGDQGIGVRREAGLKLTVDGGRCNGHGLCYGFHPELFDADEEGHCLVLVTDVPEELRSAAAQAVESCPEQALSLHGSDVLNRRGEAIDA